MLAVAQVEAMQEATKTLRLELHETAAALVELQVHTGDVEALSRGRKLEYDEKVAELTGKQRRLEAELANNVEKMRSRRADLLVRLASHTYVQHTI